MPFVLVMYEKGPIFGVELCVSLRKDSYCPLPNFPFLFLFSDNFNLKFLINYSKAICDSMLDHIDLFLLLGCGQSIGGGHAHKEDLGG